ncbi:hypothetical protein [Oceanobacillus oncorhynchi]|uniref:hypothetical protein n=1 Tax=Oceanobacillus oncorhynchi TaxID=545501 RepID=UPI0034D6ECF2
MSEINNKIDEIVEFFKDSTSWNREGLVDDIIHQMPMFKGISLDEVSVEHYTYLTDLDRFADDFFLAMLEKVTTAIESFKED